jgi:phosphomannomutase
MKPEPEYRCPGQSYPISRAVHLARMAAYYPGCRKCPHGADTDGLPRRLVRRLQETREMDEARSKPLFFEEGAAGAYLNDIGPAEAEKMAAALGIVLREAGSRDEGEQDIADQDAAEPPVVIVAGDGRPLTPELVAAVAEGLRWSGCHVADIGPASAACAAFAVGHFQADGGLLVGNPSREPQTVGLKFWSGGGRPMSLGDDRPPLDEVPLDEVRRVYEAGPKRPCRRYGSLRRLQVEDAYLATLADHYHALRPLRLLLDCACLPLIEYLQRLTKPLACEILAYRGREENIGRAVRENEAHLAAVVDGNGEMCRVLDERGQPVDADRLAELIGRSLPDALMTITLLLEILSQSDRPMSILLDD